MNIDPLLLSKKLIACNDVSSNGEMAISLMLELLQSNNFNCKKLIFKAPNHPDTANIYASCAFGNTPKLNLCFAGHLDVVEIGDINNWLSDPFVPTTAHGNLYGRGAVDMKTAVACFTAAAINIIKNAGNNKISGKITILLTNNEETDSTNGTPKIMEWLKENHKLPNYCLVGEPTSQKIFGDIIKIGRRGSINFKVKIHGKAGHVAYPNLAQNPLPMALNFANELLKTKLDNGTEHFPPSNLEITSIETNSSMHNVIPDNVLIKFNIRFNNLHTSESLIQTIEKKCIVLESYDLDSDITAEPFINNPDIITQMLSKTIQEIMGNKPSYSTSGGTSDARYITKFLPVVEFGPLSTTAHQANEHISLADLNNLYKIYLNFISKFFHSTQHAENNNS
ncbi:Succinyl-diaminopimelate desuccinylase [Candidatus Xenohaliotis californiensis]|uniref:Succinyl-diaminopimelate desuccinylase n=1 Tax=Candidatus Xenohaliotis californiensis TaxID=84677 RepID=A0ABP0EWY3_9RICK|nr:Succinyl-diaminopimelate desuccinylase [Candidatus Xenohaliotis californiensis]